MDQNAVPSYVEDSLQPLRIVELANTSATLAVAMYTSKCLMEDIRDLLLAEPGSSSDKLNVLNDYLDNNISEAVDYLRRNNYKDTPE
jgi:hypothetical protein